VFYSFKLRFKYTKIQAQIAQVGDTVLDGSDFKFFNKWDKV